MRRKYVRDLLPAPEDYFPDHVLKLRYQGAYIYGICPFHGGDSRKFSITIETGAWRCWSCSERGGSVLDFHMKYNSMEFWDAVLELGAWRDERN